MISCKVALDGIVFIDLSGAFSSLTNKVENLQKGPDEKKCKEGGKDDSKWIFQFEKVISLEDR